MSMHFDLVLMCDIREDTPESCIDLIRWLSDANSDPETRPQFDCFDENDKGLAFSIHDPFLASFPNREIISIFQKRYRYTIPANSSGTKVYHYGLQFSAHNIKDDYFFHCHLLFVNWLASIAENGFIGYFKEEFDDKPTLLYVKDRKLIMKE